MRIAEENIIRLALITPIVIVLDQFTKYPGHSKVPSRRNHSDDLGFFQFHLHSKHRRRFRDFRASRIRRFGFRFSSPFPLIALVCDRLHFQKDRRTRISSFRRRSRW